MRSSSICCNPLINNHWPRLNEKSFDVSWSDNESFNLTTLPPFRRVEIASLRVSKLGFWSNPEQLNSSKQELIDTPVNQNNQTGSNVVHVPVPSPYPVPVVQKQYIPMESEEHQEQRMVIDVFGKGASRSWMTTST